MNTEIAIEYRLFQRDGNGLLEATGPSDLDVLAAIRAFDPKQRVPRVDDSRQSREIHLYLITAVAWQMPMAVAGSTVAVDFSSYTHSIWNDAIRDWIVPLSGGSVAYPVPESGQKDVRLYLTVSTVGASHLPANAGDATVMLAEARSDAAT